MKYLEGKTRKEIAEIEGVSENVIKESLEDAKKKIKKIIWKMEEGEYDV